MASSNVLESDDELSFDEEEEEEEVEEEEEAESEYSTESESEDVAAMEDEERICVQIGKVLYENSWTGEMISSSSEFSQREVAFSFFVVFHHKMHRLVTCYKVTAFSSVFE